MCYRIVSQHVLWHELPFVPILCLYCMWAIAEDTPASSSPTTPVPTMLTFFLAGLSRLSQNDIMQIAMAVAGLVWPTSTWD